MIYGVRDLSKFSDDEKQAIITEFLPKIKSWAMRMKVTLPDSVDADDLFSAASVGLWESLDRFDKSKNVSFGTFAERRIKGAMLDSLRNLDFLPRTLRTQLKALDREVKELFTRFGRQPTVSEIVEHTGVSEDNVYRLLGLHENEKFLSLDENIGEDEDSSTLVDMIAATTLSPEDEAMKAGLTERLGEEIDKLSEKERYVVTLYYYEELTMKEVAEVMDLTESRVSQIHSAVMQKLRRRLKDFYE